MPAKAHTIDVDTARLLAVAHAEKAHRNALVAFDLLEGVITELDKLPAPWELDISIAIAGWIDENQPRIRRGLEQIVAQARAAAPSV
jgi:hypothetical protein